MAKKNKKEDSGNKVPAYIVTFSDMVTLLLTFFVMLLSLASEQDPGLIDKGRHSFNDALDTMGLGTLFGQEQKVNFGHKTIKYPLESKEKVEDDRVIDAEKQKLKKSFKKVQKKFKTMPSVIISDKTSYTLTDINFQQGEYKLDRKDTEFLKEFSYNLKNSYSQNIKGFYVLGLADETNENEMILSAKRAEEVADKLRDFLGDKFNWPVYSWGAGSGKKWTGQDSPITKESQIMIGTLRQKM